MAFSSDKNVEVGTNPPPVIVLNTIERELRLLIFPRRYNNALNTVV